MRIVAIDEHLSRTLSRMGFVGAVLIIALHTNVSVPSQSLSWYVLAMFGYSNFVNVAVPMFFAISGFLLVGHCGERGWWRQALGKRLKSLVVPYFIWLWLLSIARFAACRFCPEISPENTAVGLDGVNRLVYLMGCDVLHCNGIVWYIRSLMLFVLLAPAIVFVCKFRNRFFGCLLLSVLGVGAYLSCSTTLFYNDFFRFFLNPMGLFAFAVGIAVRLSVIRFRVGKWIYGVWAVVFLLLLAVRSTRFVHPVGFILGVVDVLVIFQFCRNFPVLDQMRGYSFGIYLIHAIVIDVLACMALRLGLGEVYSGYAILYPIRIICVLLISILGVRALRMNKHLCNYLLGGR